MNIVAPQKKVTTKDPVLKLAQSRLSVLQLAETLGNITKACRKRGMDRTSFYEWKNRFEEHGLEGLKDLPPVHHTHPQATPDKVVAIILRLSAKHPSKGCGYISHLLQIEGHYVSKVTVQEILTKHGLGSRYERWLHLEKTVAEKGFEISAEQRKYLEKLNPCHRERHIESKKPGELLCQDTFLVGSFKSIGKVYLQAVLDTYGSYAFGYLHVGKIPEQTSYILYRDVLPFYKKHSIKIGAVLTDNGKEYCGTEAHQYELFLRLNGIEHRRTPVKRPQSNGFVERFNRTALEEFFESALRQKPYRKVEELQSDFDKWLHHYNYERPHQGYRNHGRRPAETLGIIKQGFKTVRHEG